MRRFLTTLTMTMTCVLLAVAGGTGCRKSSGDASVLRLGYFPNATHAQALVGVKDGTFEKVLGEAGAKLEPRTFNAGPAAMEALLGGSLDATYVGAGPALNAYLRSNGDLRVIAGAVDGGAGLYLEPGAELESLKGLRIAVPQLGNSQDIALRHYLRTRRLDPERDVKVVTVANPEIVALFKRGELDGAWVPEPWGSHLQAAGARLALDEAKLWPEGRFHTTVLVASRTALEKKRPQLEALIRAHEALTARWEQDPSSFGKSVGEAFTAQVGAPMDEAILSRALSKLTPTLHPDPAVLEEAAAHARAVGYLPEGSVKGIVDDSLLPPRTKPSPGVGGSGR